MLYPDSGRNLSQQIEKISRLKSLASNEVSPASSVRIELIVINEVTWVAPINGWKYIGSGKWGEITQLAGAVSPFLTGRGPTANLVHPGSLAGKVLEVWKNHSKRSSFSSSFSMAFRGRKHVNFRGSSMVIVSRQDPGVVVPIPNGHFMAYEWGWS